MKQHGEPSAALDERPDRCLVGTEDEIALPPKYTSFVFTQRLVDAGADASIGSIGDEYDSAVAESTTGLDKTEVINQRGPCKTTEQVEFATLQWAPSAPRLILVDGGCVARILRIVLTGP